MTKTIKVTIENYGPDIAIWPTGRKWAQLTSWLILHSARADVLTGWRTKYCGEKYGYQMMPYIVASRYDPSLPKAWEKRLNKERRFNGNLPVVTLSLLLGGVSLEQAQVARDGAVKLSVTHTGEYYIVGEGVDARQFLYRSEMDYVLAPQSILEPWNTILLGGWAWFYFGEAGNGS